MKLITIRDLGRVVTGHTPPTKNREYYGDFYPFVKPTDMNIGEKYTYYTEEGYSELAYNKYKTSLIPKGSTCVVCIGTLGEKMTMAHCDLFTNQSVNSIIPSESYDNHYVYYLLKHNLGKVKALNKGTASGREFVSKTTFLDMPIFVHKDIEEQKRIGEILSSYDNLIENNQKQIKLLEEAAQRLYKEWFVDLRFPGHENTEIVDGVPEGWKKIPLGEIIGFEIGGGWGEEQPTEKCDQPAYVIRGTDLHDVTHGNAKSIPYRYHAQSNLASRILQDGDIVFEVSGGSKNEGVARTALITQSLIDFINENIICASFCKLIRVKDRRLSKYIYDLFQYLRKSGETVKYDKRSASSIVNYRWKDFLEQQMIFVPTEDVLNGYNAVAEHIQKSIVNKAKIIEQAKEARDRLLPKLMSGELEV